jgi:Uma2 family endonuclease
MKTATRMSDLLRSLGVSADRVLLDPAPGTATVRDLARFNDVKPNGRLCELVDGILVLKTVGLRESYIAVLIIGILQEFSRKHGNLGMVTGADGAMRLFKKNCRVPDVAFTSWDRLPNRKVPSESVPHLVPDLAVEVLSKGNRPGEMNRKLKDYFRAGVRMVWHVDPKSRTVSVFTSPDDATVYDESHAVDGGDVLPGFTLSVASLFAELGD